MFDRRIIVVAAHPDDETIGLGGQLSSMRDVTLVHVTDGAPRSRPDWKSYAQARRAELLAAANIAGVPEQRCIGIGIADQEASTHLVELTCALSRLFAELAPQIIFTHPYEGGHPDHDAAAFAVHRASTVAEIWEFCSYHRSPFSGDIEVGCFLHPGRNRYPRGAERVRKLHLGLRQRREKQRMLDCFGTQRETLRWFRVEHEQIRRAPEYDFTAPPHPGRLFYDAYNWGVTSAEWARLVRRADRLIGPCLTR